VPRVRDTRRHGRASPTLTKTAKWRMCWRTLRAGLCRMRRNDPEGRCFFHASRMASLAGDSITPEEPEWNLLWCTQSGQQACRIWISMLRQTRPEPAFMVRVAGRGKDVYRHIVSPVPDSALSKYVAALISARCVKAWGKFPRCRASEPSSSEYSPR